MVQDKKARYKEAKKMWAYLGVVLLVFVLCIPVLSREIKERKGTDTVISTETGAELSGAELSGTGSGIEPDTEVGTESHAESDVESSTGAGNASGAETEATAGAGTEAEADSITGGAAQAESVLENVWIEEIIWPLRGEVIRETGLSYAKTFSDYRYHNGIDIKAERGAEIVMTLPGRVIKKETTKDEGTVLTVEHGQENGQVWCSVYAHLGETSVKEGDYCNAGEIIGAINQPGYNEIMEGPHLHYSLFKDDQMVNPLDYLPAQ